MTTSNVTVFLSNKQDSILYTCNGINEKLGKMATASRTLSVMCKYTNVLLYDAIYMYRVELH